MGAALHEQALIVDHPRGIQILAGCSHPGIVPIVERARQVFPQKPVALVAGGFHLRATPVTELRKIADDLKSLGVQGIAPTHCSGEEAKRILRELWGPKFLSFDLGETLRHSSSDWELE
jgi:7,8-dihydropterin-6-yl-methyl-4-(beta-D-ribofuranosyl)aminobenzene 5'-phosphate synthase